MGETDPVDSLSLVSEVTHVIFFENLFFFFFLELQMYEDITSICVFCVVEN